MAKVELCSREEFVDLFFKNPKRGFQYGLSLNVMTPKPSK